MEFSPSLSRASVKSVSSQYSVEELQEKIGELRKQHRENVGEFLKVQTMQRERMIQGLEEKLAARRDRREQKVDRYRPCLSSTRTERDWEKIALRFFTLEIVQNANDFIEQHGALISHRIRKKFKIEMKDISKYLERIVDGKHFSYFLP
ncbi:hypothetical protein AVEN_233089-1 [Araneus ventricosus]|uniref:Uncharacterized protein n=1 Tax=Araneus ventricosus TaxID=182803 RepID=A0A4Y2DJ84_ARAVE|nr:hypothetical protein AVEN_233089-1 [Araneus ventricosus]